MLTKLIRDQVERPSILLHYLPVQSGQVEAIQDVVLVDFHKVFIPLGRQEPSDPAVRCNKDSRSASPISHSERNPPGK